ncbi:MAG: hypothetical protein ABIJ34_07360 [archaeon]
MGDQIEDIRLEEFRNDMHYLVSLTNHIDDQYSKNNNDTYHYLKRLRKIVERFNEKYQYVHVAVQKTDLKISVKLYIRKDSIEKIHSDITNIKKNIFDPKLNPAEVNFAYNPNRNMVELIPSPDSLLDNSSPEFRLLSKYALLSSNSDISIKEECDSLFSFETDPNLGSEGIVYTPRNFPGDNVY